MRFLLVTVVVLAAVVSLIVVVPGWVAERMVVDKEWTD